ncbi:MAG TPA: aldo/keto reductase, partial [Casimicrobiaceae bacterium]|nr:aldo/keto reductase [Casimicrobiaceae bacterium]
GTMNFGSQLAPAEAHGILDAAVDLGISFIDTAEMYSSPPSAETYGRSEEIVGTWLARRERTSVIVATKIVGPADGRFQSAPHVRHGQATLDAFHIARAIDGSLARLRTDYVDLVQFHWPDRLVPWQEQLEAIERARDQGKVRYFGCSNEGAWGLMRAVACSERRGLPRPVSVQNVLNWLEQEEYNAVEEVCREERIGFIGFSPLAMGLLSGKYDAGIPRGSRFDRFERYRRHYLTPDAQAGVQPLARVTRERGVAMAELALAWAMTRRSVTAVLTSVSRIEQLQAARRAADLALAEPALDIARKE